MQGTQNALSGAQLLKSKTSEKKIKEQMRRCTQPGFGRGQRCRRLWAGVHWGANTMWGGDSNLERGSIEQGKFVVDP